MSILCSENTHLIIFITKDSEKSRKTKDLLENVIEQIIDTLLIYL